MAIRTPARIFDFGDPFKLKDEGERYYKMGRQSRMDEAYSKMAEAMRGIDAENPAEEIRQLEAELKQINNQLAAMGEPIEETTPEGTGETPVEEVPQETPEATPEEPLVPGTEDTEAEPEKDMGTRYKEMIARTQPIGGGALGPISYSEFNVTSGEEAMKKISEGGRLNELEYSALTDEQKYAYGDILLKKQGEGYQLNEAEKKWIEETHGGEVTSKYDPEGAPQGVNVFGTRQPTFGGASRPFYDQGDQRPPMSSKTADITPSSAPGVSIFDVPQGDQMFTQQPFAFDPGFETGLVAPENPQSVNIFTPQAPTGYPRTRRRF